MDDETIYLLDRATLHLGRLDGLTVNLPNPDLFVSMYVRKEALLSSQIEGTQASLDDVLAYEVHAEKSEMAEEAAVVVNYVEAMRYGLTRLETLPLSLRLIREIHAKLLADARGSEKLPGEFRRSQNWVGPSGCTLADAAFVPPPPADMRQALGDFEKFLHSAKTTPPLVRCALMHAQFETIHPFLDGNGRIGRLLITFLLCQAGVLSRPLLYLSYYFKAHRSDYYDWLQTVRVAGDWEGWLRFFLRGVIETAQQAAETAREILEMRAGHVNLLHGTKPRGLGSEIRLLEHLFDHPSVTAASVATTLAISLPTANSLVRRFVSLGLLEETTGRAWGRTFHYQPYLAILRKGTELTVRASRSDSRLRTESNR